MSITGMVEQRTIKVSYIAARDGCGYSDKTSAERAVLGIHVHVGAGITHE